MCLSNKEKQLIVKLHKRGFMKTFIAENMGCHTNTIYQVIKKFEKGTLYAPKVRNRKCKLNA